MAGLTVASPQFSADTVSRGARTRSARRAGDAKRNRWATQDRIDNLKRLIGQFTGANSNGGELPLMETMEIAEFMEFSKSGVRKYIVELEEARVIEMICGKGLLTKGRPAYRFTGDEIALKRFRNLLDDPTFGARKRENRAQQVAAANPGSTIHVLKDDAPYQVRRHASPVTRDPLVAALFGPAPAHAHV